MDTGQLVRHIAELYPSDESIRRLLSFASLPIWMVRLSGRPVDSWFAALREADNRGRRTPLLEAMIAEYPHDRVLHEALRENLDRQGTNDHVLPGTMMVGVEKIMGAQSTLLPVAFLARGLERSRSVCRIVTPDALGTGFLIADDLLVTNHHVLGTARAASNASMQLNYQADWTGVAEMPVEAPLEPERAFLTSQEDDLTIVAVPPGTCRDWGHIELEDATSHPSRVNIIQHPGGGFKQIAMYHNVVSYADDLILQYYTDTLPGSSGSPLFDDRWRLVGVHHAGGALRSPTGASDAFRNEGIAVARLRKLAAALASRPDSANGGASGDLSH